MRLLSTIASEDRGDLPLRLAALRQQVERGNPEHYRQLALYLQVLRRLLPGAVDQACFYLATQIAPDRYAALPSLKRQLLHRRLDELVRQCSSLLTVEQLAALATRLAEERLRAHLKRRRRWLERHRQRGDESESAHQHPTGEGFDRSNPLPQGSVVLGLELPLGEPAGWLQTPMDSHSFLQDANPEEADDSEGAADDFERADDEDSAPFPWDLGLAEAGQLALEDPDGTSDAAAQESAGPPWPIQPGDPSGPGPERLGIWDSPAEAHPTDDPLAPSDRRASNGFDDPRSDASDHLSVLRASFAAVAAAASEAFGGSDSAEDQAPGLPPLPWRSGSLPKDPALLLLWLEGFEQALTRRLRNLSHAINVEFLRQELSATLLPPSLLDAVLAGRLESQSAPANLLRLQLPLPALAAPQGLMGHALLLRSGDLEGEHPQLRTCRQRLQRLRQELRKMALLQTRLQQRLRTQEAERLWLQTVRRTRPENR